MVEKGLVIEGDDEARQRENRKRDMKALCLIQQAPIKPILDRIAEASTAKEAWEMFQNEFQGSSRVLAVRHESLRQNFEILQIRDNENIQ